MSRTALYIGDSEDFTLCDGAFRVTIHHDQDHGAPWDEHDGHGPVSDWTTRDKAPGELILSEDRRSKRYYDFAEACRVARRDDWGFMPHKLTIEADVEDRAPYTACGGWAIAGPFRAYDPENFNRAIAAVYAQHKATFPSARAYAAAAAMADFNRLRDWCNDNWTWCGVVVEALDEDGEPTGVEASLWGIESDARDYLWEVAEDLAAELIAPQCKVA